MPKTKNVVYQLDMPVSTDTDKVIGGLMELGYPFAADGKLGNNLCALDMIKDSWDALPTADRDAALSAVFDTFELMPNMQITEVSRVGKYTFRIFGELR